MKGRLFLVCFGSFVHNYLLCLEKRKRSSEPIGFAWWTLSVSRGFADG